MILISVALILRDLAGIGSAPHHGLLLYKLGCLHLNLGAQISIFLIINKLGIMAANKKELRWALCKH
jgi:hypothetical protein